MEFLIQDWSKRIYVRTDALARRKDMKPYTWPSSQVNLEEMTKAEMEAYAMDKFGVKLNNRDNRETLIKEIKKLGGK